MGGAARAAGAARVEVVSRVEPRARGRRGRGASSAGRSTRARPRRCRCPGRLERRGERPLEIWDGAHNLAGIGYLLPRVPARDYVLVASILADKDARGCSGRSPPLGGTFVATASPSPRALAADELARLAEPHFACVEAVADPAAAVARARELAGPDGAVLVTGSLYLLAALSPGDVRTRTISCARGRSSVFIFAVVLLALYVGLAFLGGWLIGKFLL